MHHGKSYHVVQMQKVVRLVEHCQTGPVSTSLKTILTFKIDDAFKVYLCFRHTTLITLLILNIRCRCR